VEVSNGKMTLGNVSKQETWALLLPVKAETPNIFRIAFSVSYEKETGELFSVEEFVDISFVHPFELTYYFSYLEKRQYLQVFLKNLLSRSIEIQDYSLLSEFKTSKIGYATMILNTLEKASLLFEVDYSQPTSVQGSECKLNILCKLPHEEGSVPFLKETHNFDWPLTVKIPEVSCLVDLKSPEKEFIGSFVPFEFKVSLISHLPTNEETKEQELQYEIVIDKKTWLLVGYKRLTFSLQYGKHQNFNLNLVPLVTGFIPLPYVVVYSPKNSTTPMEGHCGIQQIFIYPRATISPLELS